MYWNCNNSVAKLSPSMININMRCIEIDLIGNAIRYAVEININMRCIEISIEDPVNLIKYD